MILWDCMRRASTYLLIVSIVVTSVCGCSSGDSGRTSVSGSVTFDGAPVEVGQVVFEPKGAGRMAIGQIADGRFLIPGKYGPTMGEYVVRITADHPTGEKVVPSSYSADQTPQDVYEQFIPAKYNNESELTISIRGNQDIERDFALTSK